MSRFFFIALFFGGIFLPHEGLARQGKPVSVSYENLTQCFPELKEESLAVKVDLNRLKELIDEKFITLDQQLRQRKFQFQDENKKNKNLILRATYVGARKIQSELTLQSVDEKGVIQDLPLTEAQRLNPKQDVIDGFLVDGRVIVDEFTYVDTKLNEVRVTYRKLFKDIQEINLIDGSKHRSVSCENEADLGIICTCSKK